MLKNVILKLNNPDSKWTGYQHTSFRRTDHRLSLKPTRISDWQFISATNVNSCSIREVSKKSCTIFWERTILIHNVDISPITDLKALYESTCTGNGYPGKQQTTARYLPISTNRAYLRGWVNKDTGQTKPEGFEYDATKYPVCRAWHSRHLLPFPIHGQTVEPQIPIMDFYLQTYWGSPEWWMSDRRKPSSDW